ncbi:hypothetical protein SNL152K_9400 [Streptomyces sp. NL15-2K]|nr:hypothetical protein SNL152K_9400 [Streptomyces sp. NL15-2K]
MSVLTAETGAAPADDDPPDTGERHRLTALTGLAALSLDAMASVAYGPEAIVLVLAAAGAHGLGFTHASGRADESGGRHLARPGLRAQRGGGRDRRCRCPGLYGERLWLCLAVLIVVGLFRSAPVSTHAASGHVSVLADNATTVGALLLKAFASGCSALTGVEALANAVPSFRVPRVRRAQRAEVALGGVLGVMAGLLVFSGGNTNTLVPLFAIGVFVGFTIAQVGMVRHRRRARRGMARQGGAERPGRGPHGGVGRRGHSDQVRGGCLAARHRPAAAGRRIRGGAPGVHANRRAARPGPHTGAAAPRPIRCDRPGVQPVPADLRSHRRVRTRGRRAGRGRRACRTPGHGRGDLPREELVRHPRGSPAYGFRQE